MLIFFFKQNWLILYDLHAVDDNLAKLTRICTSSAVPKCDSALNGSCSKNMQRYIEGKVPQCRH